MERERNNKGLIFLTIALIVAVVGLTAFIIYEKALTGNKEENKGINNTETEQFIDIEKLKKNVSKVIKFNKFNDDFIYLKLTKSGDLKIGVDVESSLYKKYSSEYLIAQDILDVYLFEEGNAGYEYIYALTKDGTINRMEIAASGKNLEFKWEKGYKNLKNIIYLDLYSSETPKIIEDAGETFEVYNQTITAVDIDGNSYVLDTETTETIYIKK